MSDCVHEWVEQPDRGHLSVHCRLCYQCAPSQMQLIRRLQVLEPAARVVVEKAKVLARGRRGGMLYMLKVDVDALRTALGKDGR